MKLGVMYSGKELESETAEYKRYRLNEKALYGGIEETEELREALSQARRESLNDSSFCVITSNHFATLRNKKRLIPQS